jgi:hypothetical protein
MVCAGKSCARAVAAAITTASAAKPINRFILIGASFPGVLAFVVTRRPYCRLQPAATVRLPGDLNARAETANDPEDRAISAVE